MVKLMFKHQCCNINFNILLMVYIQCLLAVLTIELLKQGIKTVVKTYFK